MNKIHPFVSSAHTLAASPSDRERVNPRQVPLIPADDSAARAAENEEGSLVEKTGRFFERLAAGTGFSHLYEGIKEQAEASGKFIKGFSKTVEAESILDSATQAIANIDDATPFEVPLAPSILKMTGTLASAAESIAGVSEVITKFKEDERRGDTYNTGTLKTIVSTSSQIMLGRFAGIAAGAAVAAGITASGLVLAPATVACASIAAGIAVATAAAYGVRKMFEWALPND